MGLDITAFASVELVPPHDNEESCWNNGHIRAFAYPGMERSLAGLETGQCYLPDLHDSYGFCAGSYSGYGNFREVLCETMLGVPPEIVWQDPDAWQDKPFFELIYFADNEGTIGPLACSKLALNFHNRRDRFYEAVQANYYRDSYDEWLHAFRLSADTGMVVFH